MEFYYMINYYFKYLELLDTVFLALKKKPLRALGPQLTAFYPFQRVIRIPPCFPPFRDCSALLYSIKWQN
jgi:hypothetical protein